MMLELNKIYCGDCLELMREMPDKSVDLVLTDPPYGHNNNDGDLIHKIEEAIPSRRKKRDRGDKVYEARPIENDGPEANDLFKDCLQEWNRLLRSGGCCCCCCCGGGPDPQFGRWSLWMDEVFEFKQMVIWDKGPMGMGWHYRRSYETILVGVKKGGPCKWYDITNRVENIIRDIPKIIPSVEQHPTQKPVELMRRFIRWHTKAGDIVFDPCCGSGSTLVAAKELGRNFIGIDISQEYCDMAEKRLEKVNNHRITDFFGAKMEA